MLLSLSWLREFVPYTGTALELGEKLTMLGLEMDGLSRPYAGIENIVVGHVVECARHPEAEKLSVCRVDVGDEVLDIVCGAPNVAAGQKVAVIKVGSTLPNGMVIKKAKLRGAPSHGMICSEAELGLSDDHDGIMVLNGQSPVGARLVDVLSLADEVLDISVTPNRGDCLSVLGLAREVSAAFQLPLTLPPVALAESGAPADAEIRLEVDKELSPLYQARIINGVTTGKSPAWLRYRLNSIGVRAISNMVDVTNYILMELGQPLHAFDCDAVQGGRVLVQGARAGEKFITLDGQERLLVPGDITIRDAQRAIGLGGVMGGLNSEITDKSRRVFLECAVFTPTFIRRTARRLGLHSEAAYRFERGVDQVGSTYAMNRAASMIADLAGGAVQPGVIKAEPIPFVAVPVALRHERIKEILGIPLSTDFCEQTLQRLGCTVQEGCGAMRTGENTPCVQWSVFAPSHRLDLTREADLIEELARFYGIDRIPPALPSIMRPLERAGLPEPKHTFRGRIKHWGRGAGLNEVINYSFVSAKELHSLLLTPKYGEHAAIMNPLSDEQNTLRTSLAPGLLTTLRTNLAQGNGNIRIFEVGSIFHADPSQETTVHEPARLGILLYGSRGEWPHPQGEVDYQDIKGLLEHLFASLGLAKASFVQEDALPFLSPCVGVYIQGQCVGHTGKVKTDLADGYHARKQVWMAQIDLDALYTLSLAARPLFSPLAVFPPVRRDITFMATAGIQVDSLLQAISSRQTALLEDVRLIDSFTPPDGETHNLTFRLTFRHPERTLKDAEVDKERDGIATAVQKALDVRV